ncbi:uncharacterized protein LOC125683237 isoform X2 [Ostrea edulis]|nr:uncharacterized protein LOC125683237 isoform X2 [Ostrea edulis]
MEKLTKSPIPPNVREQYDSDVQKWREEDKLYYEIHSFPLVMQKVRNQPCVTFVGVPGSGKSATAHHIALKLQEEGYEVVPVDEIREIKQYCDTKNPQVFVIDDVVGVFGLQKTKLDVLTDYEQKITSPCMYKSRTLMTCREAVFNEIKFYKPFLTKEETVIKLHSSDNALDNNDKKQILKKYGLNVDLMSPALLKSTAHMFPLLCKLFSKETKFQALGSKFFLCPVQCMIDELDDMQRHTKLNYATLVLCMLNENSLSKDILKDRKNEHFVSMKNDMLENCELESLTDAFKFVKALSAMEGTYTKQCGAQYTFIHNSLFEICAYQYGKQFPDQMLLYMSSSYIANYVKPQISEPGIVNKVKEKQSDSQSIEGDESNNDSEGEEEESDDKNSEREESSDLCIRLPEDQYPLLAERLYRDIQNMELYDVFRNRVLKHPQVCQAFIRVLETKSYTELKSVFLSSQGKVDKIASKQESVKKESGEKRDWSEWDRQRALVDERYKIDHKREIHTVCIHNVRVISWVIYYGHYHILQFIVQQTERHDEVSELFRITGNSPHQSKSAIYMNTCNKPESENIRLVEECRLLVLSCYSDDIQIFRVLLPFCKKAVSGIGLCSGGIVWSSVPLTSACKGGHISIVKELVKLGADVNLQKIWGSTPLIAACNRGHISIVKELTKAGADVNLQDRWEDTPLIAACQGGHVSTVEELVKLGADVNLQGSEGNTPLIATCRRGHVSIVKELVKAGADVNLRDSEGNAPLIAACNGGHISIVKELVKAGADVNLRDSEGNAPLIAACNGGHISIVKELVKAGVDVNLQKRRNTPLIAACQRGHVSVVEELMKLGADVNLQGSEGSTPLIAACQGGHMSIVKELMKLGADVNLQNRGNTPLIDACKKGHISIVKELVKAGADVNPQNSWGDTPLIAACQGGHVSVVEELMKVGADVNLQGSEGNTPLIAACQGGHVSVVEELMKAGADVNPQNSWSDTPLKAACQGGHVSVVEELMKAGADVNPQNNWGDTPLIAACQGGHVSVVEELMKVGADVNLQGSEGNTPLIAACQGGHVSVVEELMKAGADVNPQNNWGDTPLIAACQGGHMSIVKELVKLGADVNLQSSEGSTPLIAACQGGHMNIVKELMKLGADVNLQNSWGHTPMIAACQGGHMSIVKELMKFGTDVNPQNSWGDTPLIYACQEGRISIVKELMKLGTDVNLQNRQGNTPLIAACNGGHISIVKELVKLGADVNLQSSEGSTPLIAACQGGHMSIVKELVKLGADVNLQNRQRNTPLIDACQEGHISIVKELVKLGADVNLQNRGNTPLITAVRQDSLSVVKYVVEHGADWVTQVVEIDVSAVYKALILNKRDIVKYLIQEQNKITPGQCKGNVHLFNCLVDIRHAGVKTDIRGDVVVTNRSVWCMDKEGDLWHTICEGDCDVLRHLFCVGLDVNQSMQLYYNNKENKTDVRPLLYTLIDYGWYDVNYTTEKVGILLGAGADVNVRVRYKECDSVLDREGMSLLERTRKQMFEYSHIEYIAREYKVMCEIKKHVRRHSV